MNAVNLVSKIVCRTICLKGSLEISSLELIIFLSPHISQQTHLKRIYELKLSVYSIFHEEKLNCGGKKKKEKISFIAGTWRKHFHHIGVVTPQAVPAGRI